MSEARRNRLDEAARLAEIVGALAVVISLIYVGYEIRRNTSAQQLSNAHAANTLGHEWDAWLQDVSFAETYVAANDDFSALSPAQKVQIQKWIGEGLNIWEFVFTSYEDGLVEADVFDAWDRYSVGELRNTPVWAQVWSQSRDSYRESFQAHVATATGRR